MSIHIPLSDSQPLRKRQRARKACLPCRQRKRKCDSEFPCSMCTSYAYQCQYATDDGPASASVETLGSRQAHASPVSISHDRSRDARPLARAITSVAKPSSDLGFLDPLRRRFQGMHSVTAFPRSLGLDFQSANPPRLHSFAYNCGIRVEGEGISHADLRSIISKDDFRRFADVYFETVHPLFGALGQRQLLENSEQFWNQTVAASAFEAVIAGVAALGSFFSARPGYAREAELVQHAKGILEDQTFQPTIDHVSAWILRTLYLRSTARPHVAWLASCTTMHIAESTGLHHEVDQLTLTDPHDAQDAARFQGVCESVREVFWTAWRNNKMVSLEYGRSCVSLSNITCRLPNRGAPDAHLHAIVELISGDSAEPQDPELSSMLEKAGQIPDSHPFVSMSKADLCMSLYRHHRLLKLSIDRADVLKIIDIGNRAIAAALKLAEESKFWWNVLCTVFQYVCVLLAIDTADSLSNVANALGVLEKIASLLGTHMGHEAVNTAKVLLRDSMRKKRAEVEMLERADVTVAESSVGAGMTNLEEMDINWDMLLDPWYMSNFSGMASLGDGSTIGKLDTVR
ncbi:hypothetical protein PZA11_005786 [Diplocarpon coronariae]